ncbi:AAA family ATPase [Snuella sedimenti]|uniref:ATP-binding protein n=1 Tax=Snuella sedimenti TaxID=2798802 RepID=A0A8J7IZR9_9FLAO|nr:ATP-binding protein [Snuella sedimenti]MBJ6369665.1 ATP-binding protein [Snuella sedimenti]
MEEAYRQELSDCIKVVLFGPECTGKTILAKQLAAHYQTLWVPEYSRLYAEEKAANNQELTRTDVLAIARGQMALENKLAKQVKKLLICDTDLLETKVYSANYYNGYVPKILDKFAIENQYDLYFLTNIDIPWEADGIRDKPNEREGMFKAFQKALIENKRPYVLLEGNKKERLEVAVKHIDELMKSKDDIYRKGY